MCHINGDMQEWLVKFEQAQAIIFGIPVYFFNVSGSAKVLMDRFFPLYMFGKLANKVGGVIAGANSLGHIGGVWQTYTIFFHADHMVSADFVPAFASLTRKEILEAAGGLQWSSEEALPLVLQLPYYWLLLMNSKKTLKERNVNVNR